ncbi:MAG: hypothetical protein ACLR5Q_11380 [Coprococcus sp.]
MRWLKENYPAVYEQSHKLAGIQAYHFSADRRAGHRFDILSAEPICYLNSKIAGQNGCLKYLVHEQKLCRLVEPGSEGYERIRQNSFDRKTKIYTAGETSSVRPSVRTLASGK